MAKEVFVEEKKEKKIEVVEMKVSDIGNGFGNPRKITTKARQELQQSLDTFGDFGLILIDENNQVIAGNQRISVLKEKDPDTKVLCKKLVGYSEAELRAINIKDNVHSGEWDFELLADWTADLNLDIGIKDEKPVDERVIPEMEPIRFEKYDYVLIVCRTEIDYNELVRNLGIEGAKMKIAKRKLQARAIWYDDMKSQIVSKDTLKKIQEAEIAQEYGEDFVKKVSDDSSKPSA